MAENEPVLLSKGICQNFTPQQWRKTKCKLCFHDIIDHTKSLTTEESQEFIKTFMKDEDEYEDGERRRASSLIEIDHSYSSQSNYTQGSSDRLDVDTGKYSDNDEDETDDTHTPSHTPSCSRRRKAGKIEKQDSIEGDEGSATPNRSSQKRRTRSYRKNSSNLLQLSAMVRSSNSSLCSYTSELTDGFSDYDFDVRSVTDDTDDYAEINDVIDELEMIKPELKVRVQNERRISRSKIFDLERELEGQQDYYRASEIAKDRQIKSLQREIEGLKLELSSVKAHENILALKSRLESEGKSTRIHDLEHQVEALKNENLRLSSSPDVTQDREDVLSREVKNAHKRILHLEEENRATEERLKLAEDLQGNDRELLQYLRKQLVSIEVELVAEQDSNRLLEDKLKMMETTRSDFVKEQEKNSKLSKEVEAYRQKIKRRDRHIEDLEDDNVKLQHLKTELESQLAKKEFKVKKMERKVSELQNKVTKCNKEIADLTGENKTLEQVRRLTDLQIKDLTQKETVTEVQNGEKIFINTLEDLLKHTESRVKELELENDNFLKQIREIYDSLVVSDKQLEEFKDQLKNSEAKCSKMRQEKKHSEKKIEMLHRKLLKAEKEKKRANNRQNSAEMKLAEYEKEHCSDPPELMVESDEVMDANEDRSSRMLRLKLQSTEAKLSMIEGNKGYLESKVVALERKLEDKDQEILRLHDSMERDSGALSQDYDRFDSLDHENVILQTKFDDVMRENLGQKESLDQLKENNTILEITINNLNEKLDSCTQRLKDVEEANHKLGREAIRRTQSLSSSNSEVDASINELKVHNKLLQEKVKHFDNVEELVERLEVEVKKEQSHSQWYYEENEALKVKIAKMADTIESLEDSKKEFESSIQQLSDENKELSTDVKRLEEKLEIYGHLFGQDSILLKRRSVQSERDEEKIIENALSPLIEEIKEKDTHIKNLQKLMEDKELTISALTDEIDLLEANLAAMVTEKIKRSHGNSPIDGKYETSNHDNILSFEKYRKGSKSCETNKNTDKNWGNIPYDMLYSKDVNTVDVVKQNEYDGFATSVPSHSIVGRFSPIHLEIKLDPEHEFEGDLEKPAKKRNDNLTVSTEQFFSMLREQEELLKQKDIAYYRSLIDGESGSPTHTDFYRTIENALLDQYKDDDKSSTLNQDDENNPIKMSYEYSSAGKCNEDTSDSILESKMLVTDMYEQLAELEEMVKPVFSAQSSFETHLAHSKPSNSTTHVLSTQSSRITNSTLPTSSTFSVNLTKKPTTINASPVWDKIEEESGDHAVNSSEEFSKFESANTEGAVSQSEDASLMRNSFNESSTIDLSGLDDLLAEVNKRNSSSQEVVTDSKKEPAVKIISPTPVTVTKATTMPSIRTTKRRIIRLGGLNRSDSFDSATNRSIASRHSICSISSRSSSNIIPISADSSATLRSSSSNSSLSSCTSQISVIHIPSSSRSSPVSLQNSSTENVSSDTPLYRRPTLDANKFLSSTSNIDG